MSFIEDWIKPAGSVLGVATSLLTIYSILDGMKSRSKLEEMQFQLLAEQLGLEGLTEEEKRDKFYQQLDWQNEYTKNLQIQLDRRKGYNAVGAAANSI